MILYYYITGKDIERWFEGFLLTKPNQVLRTSIPITVENLGQSLTGDLDVSRHLAVPALSTYIQWKMEDDHT